MREHMFVFVQHTPERFDAVRALQRSGASDLQIRLLTGVARGTLRRWRSQDSLPSRRRAPPADWWPPNARAFAYLLGLYLGDGCLMTPPRGAPRLGIYLDGAYPDIVAEAAAAVHTTVPEANICFGRQRNSRVAIVLASSLAWPLAFPQHGPGRKHERKIELAPWQAEITHAHPKALLRGLIHSDGARCINGFKTRLPSGRIAEYAYPRYFFSNLSADIRRIFCQHCELLGIRWTQSNHRNISISHRDSVALLDNFIGPKR
jgi:hypothetical protein